MQTASFRFWTRIAVSISCNDNPYTRASYFFQIKISDYIFTGMLEFGLF